MADGRFRYPAILLFLAGLVIGLCSLFVVDVDIFAYVPQRVDLDRTIYDVITSGWYISGRSPGLMAVLLWISVAMMVLGAVRPMIAMFGTIPALYLVSRGHYLADAEGFISYLAINADGTVQVVCLFSAMFLFAASMVMWSAAQRPGRDAGLTFMQNLRLVWTVRCPVGKG